jgi:hypothetical protein
LINNKSPFAASSWSHTYLLINDARSLEHKEIPFLLQNTIMHQRSSKRPPMVPERSQIIPINIMTLIVIQILILLFRIYLGHPDYLFTIGSVICMRLLVTAICYFLHHQTSLT